MNVFTTIAIAVLMLWGYTSYNDSNAAQAVAARTQLTTTVVARDPFSENDQKRTDMRVRITNQFPQDMVENKVRTECVLAQLSSQEPLLSMVADAFGFADKLVETTNLTLAPGQAAEITLAAKLPKPGVKYSCNAFKTASALVPTSGR